MSPDLRAPGVEVLLVEDDPTIGRQLHLALQGAGYRATWCRTGAGGLAHLGAATCDVLLLDVGLPDRDGLEVARRARADRPDLLVIMLTARTAEIDVIAGLEAGADDYLTKPFNVTVLLARLRAHLRRQPVTAADGPGSVTLGDLTLDLRGRRCLAGGSELRLRPKEYDLLVELAHHPDEAVSREDLMSRVWDDNWHGSTKTLDVTMAALRARLSAERDTRRLRLPTIATLRGHGYRLDTGALG